MAMGSLDITTVTLIPDQLIMTQGADMPIFHITDWNLGPKTLKKGKHGLRMVVVMKRKITSEMMTTYFPSLLLTAITFATTFFKPFFFEAAVSVNLTTMLVMTTIFISKMEGLPPTSDIKMIDIWLVLCQMVPFAEVVLLTAMEHYRDDNHGYDSHREHGNMMMPLKVREGQENYSDEKRCQKCYIPELKTLGNYHVMNLHKLCGKCITLTEPYPYWGTRDFKHFKFWGCLVFGDAQTSRSSTRFCEI